MKAQVKFGEGVIGQEVVLTVQDCIVLKSLISDLKEVKEYLDKRSSDQKHKLAVNNTINFIDKVSGEVMSLEDSATEMFSSTIDGVKIVDELRANNEL